MTVLAVYVASCLCFCAAFASLGVTSAARRALGAVWADLEVLRAKDISDDEKERHARQAAFRTVAGGVRLVQRLAGVAVASALPVLLAQCAGVASAGDVAAFALRVDVMAGSTIVLALLLLAYRRLNTRGA